MHPQTVLEGIRLWNLPPERKKMAKPDTAQWATWAPGRVFIYPVPGLWLVFLSSEELAMGWRAAVAAKVSSSGPLLPSLFQIPKM